MKNQTKPTKPSQQLLRQLLLGYLAVRPRSVYECRLYLEKKQAEEQDIKALLDEFIELKLLDDAEFCRFVIRSRTQTKQRGPMAIVFELTKLGVEKSLADQVMAEVGDEAIFDAGMKLLAKNQYKLSKYSGYERKGRIYRLLAAKGYRSNQIARLIDAFEAKM